MEVFKANHLPEYIIQSFLMSGFDDIDTIMEMDVGEGPNNSVQIMENYINKKNFPRACRTIKDMKKCSNFLQVTKSKLKNLSKE